MASRKLQGEIERVLKKVDEGVGVFEQIWDKVYSAATTAQKEKYEGDLKKEIKKLQRLRDQIKTWQGDSSIKDKTKLDSNRSLIEQKMEKFKICEKETKTKAFSKEGLAQDRTDPKQKAKAAVGAWIRDAITSLLVQSEEMEAEIESLNSGKRKKRGEENPRVTELKEQISRHEHHVTMLERVLRAVDNDNITPGDTIDLKDGVDYYIESNQDPDFYEDEEMYDALNLEAVPAPATSKKAQKAQDREEDDDNSSSIQPIAAASNRKGPSSPRNSRTSRSSATSTTSSRATNNLSSAPSRSLSPKASHPAAEPANDPISPLAALSSAAGSDSNGHRTANPPLLSSVVKGAAAPKTPIPTKTPGSTPSSSSDMLSVHLPAGQQEASDAQVQLHPSALPTQEPYEAVKILSQNHAGPQQSDPRNVDLVPRIPKDSAGDKLNAKLSAMDPVLAAVESALNFMPQMKSSTPKQNPSTRNLGNGTAAPPAASPRNPVATPPSFPSVPAPVFDSREVFEQFDPDTLFFIFYYQQGTYQQYLAATELKRQGWRFHKKYLTWFQRHDEPKLSTDEFETGTFIYFDYANVVVRGQGSGWCQRIKSEFIFEYRFLEDELV